jgi:hypothetical protein
LHEVVWWWVVVRAVWTGRNQSYRLACILVRYARGSVTTMNENPPGYSESVILITIKPPIERKNEGMIAFENIEY